MNSLGPPRFDGTGFQRWKILMQSYLNAKGLNVWRVTSEGMKTNSQQEKQHDAIAKCAILNSLGENIFNRVFAFENANVLWKTISENHEGTKDVSNEKYHVLIDKLNSFKQLDHENAEAMYSRLNIFVNEINSLDVKKIEDLELIRKILHSLRRPEYDLVTSILYEKDLTIMAPNQVLNKVIAYDLRLDIKSRAPPSSPTQSALACKQVKKLKKMAIQGSSSDEEEEDARSSSSDDQEPMHPNLYKQVKKMNKCLKEINSMGYVVFLKDGPHHQLMKVEKKFKKKEKKEKKPKHETFAVFGEWVSGGEESSDSSSDESNKRFTTRFGSSSNTCLVAKGMDSDVSDDDSDAPSFEDLLDLIHEQQGVMKRQAKEIKNLNALKNLNASLTTNFDNLMCKFELLSKEHEELKLKFESINDTNDSLEMKQTTS